jgi:uncharacterized protein YbaP (TraB family)
MKRLIGLAAALFLAGCFDAAPLPPLPPSPDPALWIARGPHAAVVLFGSVHALPTRFEWEPRALELAVAHADEIWFEMPPDPQSSYQLAIALAGHAHTSKGRTLWDELKPAEAVRIRQACAKVGVPAEKLAHLRPWTADFVLGGEALYGSTGSVGGWGVERVLEAQSGPHTRRKGFETPAEHAAVLTAAAPADQIALLDATADAILAGRTDEGGRLIREWRNGDVQSLEKDVAEDTRSAPGMYRRLLTDRNRRFADAIAQRLRGKGFIVVVVGAAHMAGPQGLPALLRARGIPVDGPLTH